MMNSISSINRINTRRRIIIMHRQSEREEIDVRISEVAGIGPHENRVLWQPEMLNQRGQAYRSLSGFRIG